MFDSLSRLSSQVPEAYERASECGDLHLGDLHLIQVEGKLYHSVKFNLELCLYAGFQKTSGSILKCFLTVYEKLALLVPYHKL